jgi:polysaccharide deacetylase family protein (PEP-CTERM system associated)
MDAREPRDGLNAFSAELEDWFHILDSDKVPPMHEWGTLPLRAEKSVDRMLQLFEDNNVRATFFCLGWMAERLPHVVQRCHAAGHEIGSHGYAHLLAYQVGPAAFMKDIVRSKAILEDITGEEVVGFRSPGFSVREDNTWLFDVVSDAGYLYDASVFPAHHGHGGLRDVEPGPHVIQTRGRELVEIPASTVAVAGRRVCLFGGGYLRLSPLRLIRWGAERLRRSGRPLVVYVHPREIDPDHPRLPLTWKRRFKCYVNLRSTLPKIKWLCEHFTFTTMRTLAAQLHPALEPVRAAALARDRREAVPVVSIAADSQSKAPRESVYSK